MSQVEAELEGSSDKAKVFLSYSRKDRERAQRISDVLRDRHFGVFRDTDDILPTEEWRGRLEELINEADTIIFLLSPASANSEVCAWEVEYATSLNKRIAPIVIDEVETADIPPLLSRLNFIFCTERDHFEDAIDSLVSALDTDIEWIREHTRLNGLERRWDRANRPARLLLRGQDIADAEAWRDTRPTDAPQVSGLQASFIAESRRASGRRQRYWIGGSLIVAAATAGIAVIAYLQSVEADQQRAQAIANADQAERRRNEVLISQSLFIADLAKQQIAKGDQATAALLAIEALPDPISDRDRPYVTDGELALRDALSRLREASVTSDTTGTNGFVTLSPDGKRLTAVRRTTAHLVDVATGDSIATLKGRQEDGLLVAFAPDSERLVTASTEGTIRLLDASTGALISTIDKHPENIRSIAFGVNGTRFVTGSEDGTVRLWDGVSGDLVAELKGHKDAVVAIDFSPNGRLGSRLIKLDPEAHRGQFDHGHEIA